MRIFNSCHLHKFLCCSAFKDVFQRFIWFLVALLLPQKQDPLAGGPFDWVAILSPPPCKKFLSYSTGWLTSILCQSLVAGTTYVIETLIQGHLILNYPSYVPQRSHATLLLYATVAFALFVNTYLGWLLPRIESMVLVFYVLRFVGILIPLVHLAPNHQLGREVFTAFRNDGGWSTTGVAFFVGLIGAMSSFTGKFVTSFICCTY